MARNLRKSMELWHRAEPIIPCGTQTASKAPDQFVKGVIERCKTAAGMGFIPVQSAIGDGVIVVLDSQDEFDTYFDMDKWEYVHPEIWEGLDNSNSVGLLPGTGKFPAVSSFQEAIQFAGRHLKSKDLAWRLYENEILLVTAG